MITKETAARIWNCYREIDVSQKLLDDLERSLKEHEGQPYAGSLPDTFGRLRGLQLGVPSGEKSHRLFEVEPGLAQSVIRVHIENKRAELTAANEQARIELDAQRKTEAA